MRTFGFSSLMVGTLPEWSISTWLHTRTSIFDGSITLEILASSSSLNVIFAVSISVTFSSMIRYALYVMPSSVL